MQVAPRRCDGVILLTVIFVMVVLGLLAAFLAESVSGQYAAGSLSRLNSQAHYAAASGVEWGRERAVQAGICGPAQISLADFTVNVNCTALAVSEGAATYSMFDIDAVAVHGSYGNADFIRRDMRGRYSNR
jgi:MSHA biogenesis protein MshP